MRSVDHIPLDTFYLTDEHLEIAEANGIPKQNARYRVNIQGWSVRRAITRPVGKRRKLKKWAKIAEEKGICYSTFATRSLKPDWDLERAATEPVETKYRKKGS